MEQTNVQHSSTCRSYLKVHSIAFAVHKTCKLVELHTWCKNKTTAPKTECERPNKKVKKKIYKQHKLKTQPTQNWTNEPKLYVYKWNVMENGLATRTLYAFCAKWFIAGKHDIQFDISINNVSKFCELINTPQIALQQQQQQQRRWRRQQKTQTHTTL